VESLCDEWERGWEMMMKDEVREKAGERKQARGEKGEGRTENGESISGIDKRN
jgi:hypothetical protein